MDKWSNYVDPELHSKVRENIEVMIITTGSTKYLQPFDVEIFHDYKLIAKSMTEYSKTHRLICGGEDLSTRESIIKLHHLVQQQIAAIAFKDVRRYVFQKTLFRIEI